MGSRADQATSTPDPDAQRSSTLTPITRSPKSSEPRLPVRRRTADDTGWYAPWASSWSVPNDKTSVGLSRSRYSLRAGRGSICDGEICPCAHVTTDLLRSCTVASAASKIPSARRSVPRILLLGSAARSRCATLLVSAPACAQRLRGRSAPSTST